MSDAGTTPRSDGPRPGWPRWSELTYTRQLGLIVVAGSLLRFATLARQPLGYDEDFTAVVVQRPTGDMLAVVGRDSAPPLYYVLENAVVQLGAQPWLMRLISAVAGVVLILLLASIGRRVRGDSGGLLVAAFVAVLPAFVITSQSARMYSLAATMAVAAILALWLAVERSSVQRWLAFAALAAAALWTDYFDAVALAAALMATAAIRPNPRVLATATIASLAAVASLVPWLAFAHGQFEHAGQGFWVAPLSVESIGAAFAQMLAGPQIDPGVPYRSGLIALQAAAVVLAAAAMLTFLGARRGLSTDQRRTAVFCAIAACAGIAAIGLVSIWRPLFEARYIGVLWLPLVALIGAGLSTVGSRVRLVALGGLALASVGLTLPITHPETTSLLPAIQSRLGPHDLVVAYPTQYLAVLGQATPAIRDRLRIIAAEDPPWYDGTAAYPPGAVIRALPDDVRAHGGRVLYVSEPEDPLPDLPPQYRAVGRQCAIRVCVTTFEPDALADAARSTADGAPLRHPPA